MKRLSEKELEIKEELSAPYYIARDIERKRESIVRLRELATKTTAEYTAERVSGTEARSRVESCVVKIAALEDEIAKQETNLSARRERIMRMISTVKDIRQQQILIMYHLDCQTTVEIANELGMTLSMTKRLLYKGQKSLFTSCANLSSVLK